MPCSLVTGSLHFGGMYVYVCLPSSGRKNKQCDQQEAAGVCKMSTLFHTGLNVIMFQKIEQFDEIGCIILHYNFVTIHFDTKSFLFNFMPLCVSRFSFI
jgi:hypothetical protein